MKLGLLAGLVLPMSLFATPVPQGPTSVGGLSNQHVQHHELMRIDRDFGKDHVEIALDSWISRSRHRYIDDVRFWWVNTRSADRRNPFSAKIRKYVRFGYSRREDGALAVRFSGDRKEFRFSVEFDEAGRPSAFADLRRADGKLVRHCKGTRGRLIARRFLGIPIGLKAMRMWCVDQSGTTHRGEVPYKTLARGKLYSAD